MKKRGFCVLVFFCMAFTAYAQERYVDSLKKMYREATPDSTKADLYNRIFYHYIFLQMDSAYHYANLAFSSATKSNYKIGLATYYNNVGILNRVEGDYVEAMSNLLHSLKINEEIGYELGAGNNYVNIGLVYAAEHKYLLALDYYEKCLKIKLKHQEIIGIGHCYHDMGDCYMALGQFDKAIQCFEKAVATQVRQGLVYRALMSLGIVYYKLGDKAKAEEKLIASLAGLRQHEVFELATAYNILGKIAEDDKTYAKAIEFYEQAKDNGQKYKNKVQLKDAYQNLARSYKSIRNLEKAHACLQRYADIQDSLFNIENSVQMLRLQNSFSLRKKQNEIELMTKDKDLKNAVVNRQSMFIYGVLALAGLAILLLLVFYNNDRKTRKINQILHIQKNELAEKNEEINQQKEEIESLNENLENKIAERTSELASVINELHQKNKDLADFSYIVAHNIRAPVASIQGLLSLIDYTKVKEPTHVEVLVHIQKTIDDFKIVINDLDEILEIRNTQQHTLEEVDLQTITQALLKKMKNEIRRHKATISVNFTNLPTIYTNKNYLIDILFHLLSNAIKYQALNRPLEINLQTHVDDEFAVLEVRDNGLGIDLNKTEAYKIFGMHQRMHTHVEGKGFGLYLVKNLIEALNGKITVESEVDKGTSFKVFFPQT